MARARRAFLLIPTLIFFLTLFYYNQRETVPLHNSELDEPVPSSAVPERPPRLRRPKHGPRLHLYPKIAPKITMVLVWTTKSKTPPAYMPNFLASVAANPSLDFLIIKYDKYSVGDCHVPLASGIKNIREVCLEKHEYWNLHVKFFCERWVGGCTGSQRETLHKEFERRSDRDFALTAFRPFRHSIFHEWIHPQTKFWGWCDMDTILGNFERTFPWDVADQFDMIAAAPSVHPLEQILLYMVGHMSLLKTAPHVVTQFLKHPPFVSMDAFFNEPPPGETADEGEWSHHVFMRTNLTFLRFPAMVAHRFHIASPSLGVFYISDDYAWNTSSITTGPSFRSLRAKAVSIIQDRPISWVRGPTFSAGGIDEEVVLREGGYEGFLWFDKKFAVDILFDPSSFPSYIHKRYLMRRAPLGPVTHRIEPDQDLLSVPYEHASSKTVAVHELLYTHFQTEKYKPWWILPVKSIKPTEILVTDREFRAQVWDEDGRVTFDTAVPS